MGYIRWGGKKFYPQKPQPYKPDINELMKPLSEKVNKGNVWGSIIMKVPEEGTGVVSYPVSFVGSGFTFEDVCSNPQPIPTLYSPQPFFTDGQQLYYDSALTQFIDWGDDNNAFFASTGGTQLYFYGYANFGLTTYGFTCPTPTPTPSVTPTMTVTPTPTPTPSPSAIPSGTTEAETYLNAVVGAGGTVDSTMSAATITMFQELFSTGLWNKMTAFYPFMGGTADAHKFNGKNPLDTDAAYRIEWYGTVSHDVSGATGNGSNGYGDTNVLPSTALSNNDTHLYTYVNNNTTRGVGQSGFPVEIGRDLNVSGTYLELNLSVWTGIGGNSTVGTMYSDPGQPGQADGIVSVPASSSNMSLLVSRTSSTVLKLYKEGSLVATETASNPYDVTNINQSILLWQDGTGAYSNRRQAFVSIGSGLNDTEAQDLHDIVDAFNTALSRNN